MSHIPGISMKTSGTLTAYRGVVAATSTANTVKYPGAATDVPFGITGNDVLDSGQAIEVFIGGIHKLYFNDTVTSGGLVALDTSGRGVPHVNTTAGSYVIGSLIGPTVAATGTIAEVLINPFFKSIP